MGIIESLILWIKACFFSLKQSEFCALCEDFERKESKLTRCILAAFFKRNGLEKQEIDAVYKGSYELRWLYLENINPQRKLSAYEQHCLVRFMPLGGMYGFPSALDLPILKELFAFGDAAKLSIYVRDFALPPELEMKLIELCRAEPETQKRKLNSYHNALLNYLSFCNEEKLTTVEIQMAILSLEDDEITKEMVNCCSMDRNILFDEVLSYLLQNADAKVLRLLLFKSYIDAELAENLLQKHPQLKRLYDISVLRRAMRQMEIKANQFWGIIAPNKTEFNLILAVTEKEDDTFVPSVLLPLLEGKIVTPYFAAWCAYHFPQTQEEAYLCVRQTADLLVKKFKKKILA